VGHLGKEPTDTSIPHWIDSRTYNNGSPYELFLTDLGDWRLSRHWGLPRASLPHSMLLVHDFPPHSGLKPSELTPCFAHSNIAVSFGTRRCRPVPNDDSRPQVSMGCTYTVSSYTGLSIWFVWLRVLKLSLWLIPRSCVGLNLVQSIAVPKIHPKTVEIYGGRRILD
jgi:hypothetical protein